MVIQERKYPSWGEFLKKKRGVKFRSAREFCTKVDVGISYPQYSRYEAGDQLPNLDQALKICRFLDVDSLEGLLEWSLAQVSNSKTKKNFEPFLEQVKSNGTSGIAEKLKNQQKLENEKEDESTNKPASLGVSLFQRNKRSINSVFVFNRSHLNLFLSNPEYRDIFTYINSYSPEWIPYSEIALAIEKPVTEVEEMLEKLSDLGVLLLAGGKCRTSKKTFYFPDDEEFFELRNKNLEHNFNKVTNQFKFSDLETKKAHRSLITRELTQEQLEQVIVKIDQLKSDVLTYPETDHPEVIYSLCIALGERFKRSEVLKKSDESENLAVGALSSPNSKNTPPEVSLT